MQRKWTFCPTALIFVFWRNKWCKRIERPVIQWFHSLSRLPEVTALQKMSCVLSMFGCLISVLACLSSVCVHARVFACMCVCMYVKMSTSQCLSYLETESFSPRKCFQGHVQAMPRWGFSPQTQSPALVWLWEFSWFSLTFFHVLCILTLSH